jgi:hypothetical protein
VVRASESGAIASVSTASLRRRGGLDRLSLAAWSQTGLVYIRRAAKILLDL